MASILLCVAMDFENLKLHPRVSSDRIYVSWTEQWDIARYVDHYIADRKLRVSDDLRATLTQRIAKYPWAGPRKKADMDRYLDTHSPTQAAE
jgi:hypothetical protein